MIEMPRHREAFPALNVREAMAAVAAGRPVCNYTRTNGTLVGQAFFVRAVKQDSGAEFLVFGYSFVGEHFSAPPETVPLRCMRVRNGLGQERVYVRCNRCKRPVEILIFRGSWACGRCHRLAYRSQVIPHDVKMWERVRELQTKIGAGRPHRMRQATFHALQKELESLKKAAGRVRKVASVRHSSRIDAQWVSPAAEGFELRHSEYMVSNGEIFDRPLRTDFDGESLGADQADGVTQPRPSAPETQRRFRPDPAALGNESLRGKSHWHDDG